MARRRRLTLEQVHALPTKPKRYTVADPELPAHYVRVFPSGVKSFVCVRILDEKDDKGRFKQKWVTLGDARKFNNIDEARARARAIMHSETAPEAVEQIAKLYLDKHASKLRSADSVALQLRRLVDAFRGRPFNSLKRRELAELADKIKAENGTRSAQLFLSIVGGLCNWYAMRDEDYASPLVSALARQFATKARDRVLSDEEIRAVWQAATDRGDTFSAFVKLLLLTGQRREKVASMKWADLQNGVWHIPTEAREKGNGEELVLPQMAIDIINAQPRIAGNAYVLSSTQSGLHLSNFWHGKHALDKASGVTEWRLHDLRRTARSLMSRAGVRPDVAERVLGHVAGGIEKVYDRYRYVEEKGAALKVLAGLIQTITDRTTPPNVVPMPHRAA
jgi:integrase